MFHAFDSDVSIEGESQHAQRQQWIALLARAPEDLLESALAVDAALTPQWLRRPETGLMMVQGRIGGTGERFNVGEITVTRCALRLAHDVGSSAVGVSYVLGRNHRQARLAALADALLQDPTRHEALQLSLLEPVRQYLEKIQWQRHQRAQTTKVDFLTVAREAGDSEEAEVE